MEERTFRSPGACNSCRAKKQKCNGEKPICMRCRDTGQECIWPQQQKRGPAKGYTEALEKRLQDTEQVLSALLSTLSPQNVAEALQQSSFVSRELRQEHSATTLPDRKRAVEMWANYPLNSLIDIQRWQQQRSDGHSGPSWSPHQSSQNINHFPAMFANEREFEGRQYMPEEQRVGTGQDSGGSTLEQNRTGMDDGASTVSTYADPSVDSEAQWVGGEEHEPPPNSGLTGNNSLGLSEEFQQSFLW